MNAILVEGNMDGLGLLVFMIFFVGFGIPIILAIIGGVYRAKKKKNTAKVLWIISGIYLLISLGVCASLLGGF
ncbi:hypothetical protein POV27_02745 [Aureisphaera galaxeae]|uniref:hypothetical protein n=1 Tax=Aureisphaera galaxeae TaxID=1538023 RepID=UPI002350B1AC|nr:hypothetical protein [Aureisphaera galaxeae]MDC8002950.1 hypothetical protein [Aureisphaera galaxeae]